MSKHLFTVIPYIYEKYSVFDIKEYLESAGYHTKFSSKSLDVDGTDVFINIPLISIGGLIFADIRFPNINQKYDLEINKKLFGLLSGKFGRKRNDPYPNPEEVKIKDADRLKIVNYSKKGWQFWR